MHAVYDPLSILGLNIGPGMVDVFERVGFFRVFSAPWFILLLTLLVVSIVVCTLDRRPTCGARRTTSRSSRRRPSSTCACRAGALRRLSTMRPRPAERSAARAPLPRPPGATDTDDGGQVLDVYGDENQYLKLATLFTHLGLILFLAGGRGDHGLGYETVVFLGEGQTAPVQAVGTPDNLLVKNIHFEAPTDADGTFADFRTDLAVYQNGAGGRAQDHPRQRPARGQRLRLPPEHVRTGRRPADPRPAGSTSCGTARCSLPASWPASRRAS